VVGWYEVISEAASAPEMTGLRAARVFGPTNQGRGFYISFSTGYPQGSGFEKAVGVRCRVIRLIDDQMWDRSGVVLTVHPRVMVAFDGTGWQPIADRRRQRVVIARSSRHRVDYGFDRKKPGPRRLGTRVAALPADEKPAGTGLFRPTVFGGWWSRTVAGVTASWRLVRRLIERAQGKARARLESERGRAERRAARVAEYRAGAIDAEAFEQPGGRIDTNGISDQEP
jgi:hypothetical protein